MNNIVIIMFSKFDNFTTTVTQMRAILLEHLF